MKIFKIISTVILLFSWIGLRAQLNLGGHFYGEDALRYSQTKIFGTARVQGMGGSFTSIGADASNAANNPAGLGFYNRSELSVSPVFQSFGANAKYADSYASKNQSNMNIGQLALVMSNSASGSRKKRSAFAITYSKQLSLMNQFDYLGQNKRSSMMDFFAEKATMRGANSKTLDDEFNVNSASAATSTAMYYQAYMIDPISGSGAPYQKVEASLPVNQQGSVDGTGVQSQWNIAYGANFDDKTYLGFTIGFTKIANEVTTAHKEMFPNGNIFNAFEYSDNLYVRGGGLNLGVGAIVKLTDNINLGANITSPSWYTLSEVYNSKIKIDVQTDKIQPNFTTIKTDENQFNYNLSTPFKASGGFTFFLPNKAGMISADAEYVAFSSMKINDSEDKSWSADQNRTIKNNFKDVVNLKIGGEYRIQNFRMRLGAKFQPNPIKKTLNSLSNSQMLLTAGVGYRTAKYFVDLAGVSNSFQSAYTPYELANTQNYGSVAINNKFTSIVLSLGTFF